MQKRTSQTKRLSGRAQSRLDEHNRADDEHAAHRGRALLSAMQFSQAAALRPRSESVARS